MPVPKESATGRSSTDVVESVGLSHGPQYRSDLSTFFRSGPPWKEVVRTGPPHTPVGTVSSSDPRGRYPTSVLCGVEEWYVGRSRV